MDPPLERLVDEHKLGHFKAKFVEMGLTCIDDLQLVEDVDLAEAGLQKIQVRAFHRLKEAAAGGAPAAVVEPGSRPAAQLEEAAELPAAGAPCATGLENAGISISAVQDVVCAGAKEAPALAEDSGFCIVPDGAPCASGVENAGISISAVQVVVCTGAKEDPDPAEESGFCIVRDGAPCATGLENAGTSIADVVCTGAKKGPAPAEDSGFCIVLDGANIMRWSGSTGAPKGVKDDARLLRCAFDWFRRHLPSCRVEIYLYCALEHRCRRDANLEDIWASVTLTPSGQDVDLFLLRAAAQGMYGLPVIICTNDCFDAHKGTDMCGQAIDAQWVKRNTLKYLFAADASFQPAWTPDHPLASKVQDVPPPLPPFPGSSHVPRAAPAKTDSLTVEVLGQRSCILRVGAESPATLRCPGRGLGCELQLSLSPSGAHGDGGSLLELVGLHAPSHRQRPQLRLSAQEVKTALCPTCGTHMEFRSRAGADAAAPVPGALADEPSAAAGFAFVATLWAPPAASGPDPDGHAERQLARYCLDALVLGHSLGVHAGSHDRILNCTPDALRRIRRLGWSQLLELAGWQLREVQPVQAVEALVEKCAPRFRGTFTKLQALGLTQYERIAIIDIDMLAKQDVGDLADAERFPAPMAVARVNKRNVHLTPGERLKSRDLFNEAGEQRYGINAGLVILDTSAQELESMLSSVGDPRDRSHLATYGPEQDFLTRWPGYYDKWHHLDLRYNFQLHQLANVAPGDEHDRRRLPYEEVKVLHFSTEPKPSDFFFQSGDSPIPHFADFVAQKLVPQGCEDWVRDTMQQAATEWHAAFLSAWEALTTGCSACPCPAGHSLWQCPDVLAEAGLAGKRSTEDGGWLLRPGALDLEDGVALLSAARRLRSPQASGRAVTEANVAAAATLAGNGRGRAPVQSRGDPAMADAAEAVAQVICHPGLDSAWSSALVACLQGPAERSEAVRLVLQAHGWDGRQFRSPPDRHALLKDFEASGQAVAEVNVAAEAVDPLPELPQSRQQGVALPSAPAPAPPAAAHVGSTTAPQASSPAPQPSATPRGLDLPEPGQDSESPPRRVPRVRERTLIDRRRDEILAHIKRHRILIIVSSTGSGKSTAVPRMIVEECEGTRVACTQPRRIAATSLARRVATVWTEGNRKEGREQVRVGEEVGYQIGGCNMVKDNQTLLVFMTTATAMLQLLQSGFAFTHLVIDEVHERSIFIDILLTVIRSDLTGACRNLNVTLMSAAMDAKRLCAYFADAGLEPHLMQIDVKPPYPVDIRPLERIKFFWDPIHGVKFAQDEINNQRLSEFILDLHRQREHPVEESFLVFLSGKADVQEIMEHLMAQKKVGANIDVKPVYGGMSIEAQERILQSAGGGRGTGQQRTVILATDVVESSVTIPDVAVVIDTLQHKRKRWDKNSNQCPLTLEYISRDEVKQRSGRTGRTRPGTVYQLMTKPSMDLLREHAIPQIWSDRLEEMLLSLLELRFIADPQAFLRLMPDPPEPARVKSCMRRFLELNAVERVAGTTTGSTRYVPTHFGRFLKFLPLDTEVGNLVMNGLRYGIIEQCVILAAVHQRGEPFVEDPTLTMEQAKTLVRIRSVCSGAVPSDLIAGYMAYRAWRCKLDKMGPKDWPAAAETSWCTAHYLSLNKLHEIEELRVQIFETLRENGYHTGVREEEKELLRRRRRMKEREAVEPQALGQTPNDPVLELERLLRAEHANRNLRSLMHWCLAAAFLHGTLVCWNHDRVQEIKFDQWKGMPSVDTLMQRDWLLQFLNGHGMKAKDVRIGSQGDVFVKFQSAKDSRFALQACTLVGANTDLPFKRCSKWGPKDDSVDHLNWCGADCKVAQNSLAALPEDSRVTVVASEFLLIESKARKNRFLLCTKCSVVPNDIVPLVVLATYNAAQLKDDGNSMQVQARFFGVTEEWRFEKPRDKEVLKLVLEIRQGLDEEFRGPMGMLPPNQRDDLVSIRQEQVLKLMGRLEAGTPMFSRRDPLGSLTHHFHPQQTFAQLRDIYSDLGLGLFDVDDA